MANAANAAQDTTDGDGMPSPGPAAAAPTEHPYDFSSRANADNAIVLRDFGTHMHKSGASSEAVDASLQYLDKVVTRERQKEQAIDQRLIQNTETALRTQWGGNYDANHARIKDLLKTADPEVAADVAEAARYNPKLGNWLLSISGQGAPAPSRTGPQSFSNTLDVQAMPTESRAVESEIRQLEAMMAKRSSPYWKGATSAALQARYRLLVSQRG